MLTLRLLGHVIHKNAHCRVTTIGCKYFSTSYPEDIQKLLKQKGITTPTPVQEKCIPLALEKKDFIGVARTGSGKTLAFVLPLALKLLEEKSVNRKPFGLIIAPARELAVQIEKVVADFPSISSIALVGGRGRSEQVQALLNRNHDVLIVTPGRCIDLLESNIIDLSEIKYVVIDEADRLLDMGFEVQLRKIIDVTSKDRQTLMFSATWPKDVRELARAFMKEHDVVEIDSLDLKANPNIEQRLEYCPDNKKIPRVIEILKEQEQVEQKFRALIFANMKRRVHGIHQSIRRERFNIAQIHGSLTQSARESNLTAFSGNECNLLVATDVAARGLDIKNVTHVINFDLPQTIPDYIHRIGRTGRVNNKGVAISFYNEKDVNIIPKLIKQLHETNSEVPDRLEELARSAIDQGNSRSYRQDFRRQGGYYQQNNWRQGFERQGYERQGYDRHWNDRQGYDRQRNERQRNERPISLSRELSPTTLFDYPNPR